MNKNMSRNMRVLVTGATGFIGKNLVEDLLVCGFENLYVLVKETSDVSYLQTLSVKFVYADVGDRQSLFDIKESFDVVYHCAGCVNDKDRERLWKVNVEGTENICLFAKQQQVERLIYVSSVAVISGNFDVPLVEGLPYAATNLYGQSKLEGEEIAVRYRDEGLPMVIVRPPMIYGQDEPHMLKYIIKALRMNVLLMVNRGSARLHLGYVKNVSDFLVECGQNDKALGGVYFIADEEALMAAEVFKYIADGLGTRAPVLLPSFLTPFIVRIPKIGRRLKFFIKDRVYSLDKIKNELNYTPKYKASDMLIKTGEYYGLKRVSK